MIILEQSLSPEDWGGLLGYLLSRTLSSFKWRTRPDLTDWRLWYFSSLPCLTVCLLFPWALLGLTGPLQIRVQSGETNMNKVIILIWCWQWIIFVGMIHLQDELSTWGAELRPFPSVHCVHNKGEMKLSEHWPVINQILTSGHNNNQTSPKLLNCNSSDLSAVGSQEWRRYYTLHRLVPTPAYCSIIRWGEGSAPVCPKFFTDFLSLNCW